ncbi:transposase domain-containing protein [Nonomuraea sp. NPDC050451]|uniref:transposase domain-containing protein n=1 Tax=Nonomuraea sp. NPDC050451 TaxID=3364364 RepID=UPI003797CE7F
MAPLAETGRTERRLRVLPSRVGVYFVLALKLFGQVGARLVWQKLICGLAGLAVVIPSEKALRDLRRRIGAAPLKALFETLAVPLAHLFTPGTRYRRWRTVAMDGCGSLKVPDHERNRGWLGKLRNRMAHPIPTRPPTPLGCCTCSTATCCCWPTAASTATTSCKLWPAPGASSWPAADPGDACPCWPC